MADVTYASLATLRKGIAVHTPTTDARAEVYGVIYADLQNVFDHATCHRCGNLVDQHQRALDQPGLGTAIAVVSCIAGDQEDFSVSQDGRFSIDAYQVLLRQDARRRLFAFPEGRAQPGERLSTCAVRLAREELGISARAAFCVSCHGDESRSMDAPHVLSVLHLIPAPPGVQASMFPLRDVLAKAADYPLRGDHRDMLSSLVLWLKNRAASQSLKQIFAPTTPYELKRVVNPAFGTSHVYLTDRPLRSFTNPYFDQGLLIPGEKDDPVYSTRTKSFQLERGGDPAAESDTDMRRRPSRRSLASTGKPASIPEESSMAAAMDSPPAQAGGGRRPTSGGSPGSGSSPSPAAIQEEGDKDTVPRARGKRPDGSKRDSMEVLMQADFNPLADDFQADFSNPLLGSPAAANDDTF